MIKDIRHTGIVVADLEASLKFYQDILGFSIVKKMDETGDFIDNILLLENVKVTTVKMASSSGQMIELLKYQSHPADQKNMILMMLEFLILHLPLMIWTWCIKG